MEGNSHTDDPRIDPSTGEPYGLSPEEKEATMAPTPEEPKEVPTADPTQVTGENVGPS